MCFDMPVDHGLLTPLPLLWSHDPAWNVQVIPLAVNVLLHPLPTGLRCFKLGQAIRRAVESYPEDIRVAVVGTGGLSHQLNGERFGFLSPDFDKEWLDRIVSDPDGLTKLSHDELMERAGAEAVEVIMWLIMRGAMSSEVVELHRNYYAPMVTGMGLITMVDA
jgi:protocatechuate 4,5-dioxygenase beta chain